MVLSLQAEAYLEFILYLHGKETLLRDTYSEFLEQVMIPHRDFLEVVEDFPIFLSLRETMLLHLVVILQQYQEHLHQVLCLLV